MASNGADPGARPAPQGAQLHASLAAAGSQVPGQGRVQATAGAAVPAAAARKTGDEPQHHSDAAAMLLAALALMTGIALRRGGKGPQ